MAAHEDLSARVRSQFDEVPWSRLVGIGDSMVEGELSEPSEGYPDVGWYQQIGEALKAAKPGFAYKTCAKRYLKSSQILETQLPRALEFEPDSAIVAVGGNDLLVEQFDARITEANLEAILGALAERGATVFVITIYDIFSAGIMPQELSDLLAPRFAELRETTIDVARRSGSVLVDLHLQPVSADPSIYTSDLQHCTRKGHRISAQIVLDHMAEHARSAAATT
jgi:lysophospholipase L1-like esterase